MGIELLIDERLKPKTFYTIKKLFLFPDGTDKIKIRDLDSDRSHITLVEKYNSKAGEKPNLWKLKPNKTHVISKRRFEQYGFYSGSGKRLGANHIQIKCYNRYSRRWDKQWTTLKLRTKEIKIDIVRSRVTPNSKINIFDIVDQVNTQAEHIIVNDMTKGNGCWEFENKQLKPQKRHKIDYDNAIFSLHWNSGSLKSRDNVEVTFEDTDGTSQRKRFVIEAFNSPMQIRVFNKKFIRKKGYYPIQSFVSISDSDGIISQSFRDFEVRCGNASWAIKSLNKFQKIDKKSVQTFSSLDIQDASFPVSRQYSLKKPPLYLNITDNKQPLEISFKVRTCDAWGVYSKWASVAISIGVLN